MSAATLFNCVLFTRSASSFSGVPQTPLLFVKKKCRKNNCTVYPILGFMDGSNSVSVSPSIVFFQTETSFFFSATSWSKFPLSKVVNILASTSKSRRSFKHTYHCYEDITTISKDSSTHPD